MPQRVDVSRGLSKYESLSVWLDGCSGVVCLAAVCRFFSGVKSVCFFEELASEHG